MYALMLQVGIGVDMDLKAAREATQHSCDYGDADPACTAAAALRLRIDKELAGGATGRPPIAAQPAP